jgi:hypothetical protein
LVNEKVLDSEEMELPEGLVVRRVGGISGNKDNSMAVTFEVGISARLARTIF